MSARVSPHPCDPSCPGWAIFNELEYPAIERCDECWSGVEDAMTDADYESLPECQAALAKSGGRVVKKSPRAQLEALVWKHTHQDFKGVIDGVRYRLHLNEKKGGTESWPLSTFTNEQLIDKLPRKVRETDEVRALIARL